MGATKNVLLVESDSGNYSEKVHATNSLLVSGTMTAGNVPVVQEDGTVVWTAGAINTVSSVFGRTGAITAQSGDYTKAQVGLGNVENTAISTWVGSSNITTVGTLTSGAINGITGINNTPIGSSKASTGKFTNMIADGDSFPVTINSVTSTGYKLEWKDNGTRVGFLGAASSTPLIVYDTSGTNLVSVRSTGNLLVGITSDISPVSRLVLKTATSDGSTDGIVIQDSVGGEIFAVDSEGNADFFSLRTDSTNAWKLYGEDTTANSTECKLKVNVAGTDYWISAVKAAA